MKNKKLWLAILIIVLIIIIDQISKIYVKINFPIGEITRIGGLSGDQVGKISIFDHQAFVAVERLLARQTQQRLEGGKIKGRSLKIRVL